MWINSILFAAGMLLCQQLPELPALTLSLALLLLCLAVLFCVARQRSRCIRNPFVLPMLFFGWGFLWAVVYGHWLLTDRLSAELVKKPVEVIGTIQGLPVSRGQQLQFTLQVEQGVFQGKTVKLPGRIDLSWYRTDVELRSGEKWRMKVKLKPPTGLRNPGLFDYETWLFTQRIGARGYVIDEDLARKLETSAWHSPLASSREHIRQNLDQLTAYPRAIALIKALSIGDKSSIAFEQWQTFRSLGVNHLVAISGLHIGMVAGLFYWLSGVLWRCSAHLCARIPAVQVQAISALLAATAYAAMAGFSLPTQRALVMLLLLLGSKLLLINMQPRRQLAVAFILLLLWDPPAVISPGFWLSFTAVAAIFLALHVKGNPGLNTDNHDPGHDPETSSMRRSALLYRKLLQLILLQWHISLALLPLQVFFFSQVSLIAPLVNLVLIPLFGLLVVPLSLLLAMLSPLLMMIPPDIRPWLETGISLYLASLDKMISLLDQLALAPGITIETSNIDEWVFMLMLIGIVIWFFTGTWWSRGFSLLLLGALLFTPAKRLPSGHLAMTVLDVGQGTAVLIEKNDYLLLYDLGPRYGQGKSATRSVVIPFLKNRQLHHIDRIIISHADSDHAGDYRSVLDAFDVTQLDTGEKLKLNNKAYRYCRRGDRWQSGNTHFEILHPGKSRLSGNNASCVLRITHAGRRILLTGDIERRVENRLLKTDGDALRADIVLVPHHGSLTSSTRAFIEQVSAKLALNTSGYLNRYQFPRDAVMKRWHQAGTIFLDTGLHGALQIQLDDAGKLLQLDGDGFRNRRYWHTPR